MKKAQALRDWILRANPDRLADHEDSLVIFVEKGAMACRSSPGLGFEYRYTLQLGVTDFGGELDTLMLPVLAWVAAYQPELLASPDTYNAAVRWSAEMVDNAKLDVLVELDLTESVRVSARPDGAGYDVVHLDEIAADGDAGMHWALYLQDQLVAEWDEPA